MNNTKTRSIWSYKAFMVVWAGQFISVFGSQVTAFALSIWIFHESGSVIEFGMIIAAQLGPAVLLSPIAGVMVDRMNRRTVMLLCDLGMLLVCIPLCYWAYNDLLTVTKVLYLTPLLSVLAMTHNIAYSSSIALLVPKASYGSANALVQLAANGSAVIVPVLAVLILELAGPSEILMVNIVTYVFAILSLLVIRFPYQIKTSNEQIKTSNEQIKASNEQTKTSNKLTTFRSLIREQKFGFQFMFRKNNEVLLSLLAFLCFVSLLNGLIQVLFRPMILINQSAMVVGWLVSIAGVGGLSGAIFSSLFVNKFDKSKVLINFCYLASLSTLLCGLSSNNVLLGVVAFVFSFSIPIVMVASQTLWQLLVPVDLQGRVFATRTFCASIVLMLSVIVSPLLSELVFKVLIENSNHELINRLFPIESGGMKLAFVVTGLLVALATMMASRGLKASQSPAEPPLTEGV